MEEKFGGCFYIDCKRLYSHLMELEGAECESNYDEFIVCISYTNADDLIKIIDHVRDYYEGWDNQEGLVESTMAWIWEKYDETEEERKILDESYGYWKKMIER